LHTAPQNSQYLSKLQTNVSQMPECVCSPKKANKAGRMSIPEHWQTVSQTSLGSRQNNYRKTSNKLRARPLLCVMMPYVNVYSSVIID